MGAQSKKQILKESVSEDTWEKAHSRLKEQEAFEVLREFFDRVVDTLVDRIDDIGIHEEKAIWFLSRGREILRINVGRSDLRIYLHPAAGASFSPDAEFAVDRFRFWDGSFRKGSGKYHGMSFWLSEKRELPGAESILQHIPKTSE